MALPGALGSPFLAMKLLWSAEKRHTCLAGPWRCSTAGWRAQRQGSSDGQHVGVNMCAACGNTGVFLLHGGLGMLQLMWLGVEMRWLSQFVGITLISHARRAANLSKAPTTPGVVMLLLVLL
jgi:hypothetical protein